MIIDDTDDLLQKDSSKWTPGECLAVAAIAYLVLKGLVKRNDPETQRKAREAIARARAIESSNGSRWSLN